MKTKLLTGLIITLTSFLILTIASTVVAKGPAGKLNGQFIKPGLGINATHADLLQALPNDKAIGYDIETNVITLTTGYLPAIFKEPAFCSTIPTLIDPANASNLNTIIPQFTWDLGNGPDGTLSRMQISRDSDFTQVRWDMYGGSTTGLEVIRIWENLEPGITYYWRTWLMCGDTQGPYSEVWSFTTASSGEILPAPTLIAPANGSTVTSGVVTLQWEPVPGAVDYLVHWKKVGGYGSMVSWVNDTQRDIYIENNSTYQWSVEARNDYALGVESEAWQFVTQFGPLSVQLPGWNVGFRSIEGDATIFLVGQGAIK